MCLVDGFILGSIMLSILLEKLHTLSLWRVEIYLHQVLGGIVKRVLIAKIERVIVSDGYTFALLSFWGIISSSK